MIFMVFQRGVYKEFLLPNSDNIDYKIYIDKSFFQVRKSFDISLEVINHKWNIYSDPKYYILGENEKNIDRASLDGGEIITVKPFNGDDLRVITINNEISLVSYRKINLKRMNRLTVGKAEENSIQYSFLNLVSKQHCSIVRSKGRFCVYDSSRNGVFLNSVRVDESAELSFGDIINVFGLQMVFLGDMIAVGSQIGKFTIADEVEIYDVPKIEGTVCSNLHKDLFFHRSPRFFPAVSREKITIEPPTTPQFSKKRSLLSTIGPSFTMAIPMLLGCSLMIFSSRLNGGSHGGGFMYTGIITALGSGVMGAIWGLRNVRETKKSEIEDEAKRFNLYGNYLIETANYIKEKYKQNTDALFYMYPSSSDCCRYDRHSHGLWTRNAAHEDFLFCRLGLGDIDFQVQIDVPKEKFTLVQDSLKDKPAVIYENFHILKNVPVGVNFSESRIFGIVGGRRKQGMYDIIDNIIAQITANISYTDVKIAFCYDRNVDHSGRFDYIKWLPHVWSENKKIRYYASDKQEMADVFFELSNIMRHRAESNSNSYGKKKSFRPYYFLFLTNSSFLDNELLAKYVYDKNNDYGLTTFIMTDYYQNLPNECENIIENDKEFCGVYNSKNQSSGVMNIKFDKVEPYRLEKFAKEISNIIVKEPEDDTSIASTLDFFEMYGASSLSDFAVEEQWRKNRTYNSMRALIGKKAGGTECYLDIHEKYHGPHGLVAGTTGSGKSELMQTFMLSLALNYSPNDIAFFVIDFKGGGMANLFSDLPHMAGQISNLSGNQIGRAMISIKSENLRRQRIFNEFGVNNINLYTRLFKNGEAPTPIPHLIIIIDEFAELKREEPDFMRELISVAQVGRSLGVHLILATQKPSGTVDDNIWSNAKFRLCLRVQDRQDSNDMLHKPDAAYITQAGRCYLQVGNDEIYELFQSGWSGAVYDASMDSAKNEIATMITSTGKTAIVGGSTKKKRKEQEKHHWYKFLIEQYFAVSENDRFMMSDTELAGILIKKAQLGGYNVGTGNSDVKAMQNFIKVIPHHINETEMMLSFITERAIAENLKLPEVKEKTQLEVLVEYIKKIAEKEHYVMKSQLWMPLLENEIPLSSVIDRRVCFENGVWKKSDSWSLDVPVGLYDDPQNQSQLPLVIDFAEGGHLAVCGSAVSGKSTFLQTLLFSAAIKYSPDHVNFYILDFSSGMLSVFAELPHTGGIVNENSLDRIGKFFNMIKSIIEERKKLFNGGNYSQFVKAHGIGVPSIIIAIDNYAGFKEKTNNAFEENIIRLAREGVGYGIFLVLTSAGFGLAEIPNRIGDNMKTVISLEMSDKFKYMDVMRVTRIDIMPEPGIKGRGIAFVEGRLLEFQTSVAVSAEDDYKRNGKIESLCRKMSESWTGQKARCIPFIPENPTFEDISALSQYEAAAERHDLIPFGYRFEDASVYSVDLRNTYCYCISGKKRTGKTNVMKLLMIAAASKAKGSCAVIEKNLSELKSLSEEKGIKYLSSDEETVKYFNGIVPTFVERNNRKKSLSESGMNDREIFEAMKEFEPIYIFIADITEFIGGIYNPTGNVKNISGFFENIFEKGSLLNIYFFSCINTDDVALIAGKKAYTTFISYKTGVNLGGNVSSQRIFNFQNIHYSQLLKSSKKGEALVPSHDDDTAAEKVIVPLIGGRSV